MSQQLINLNPELKRLRDEGYNVCCKSGLLVVDEVPYVGSDRTVKKGRFVMSLALSGNQINGMDTHIAHFAGEYPCDVNGAQLPNLRCGGAVKHLPDLGTDVALSLKLLDDNQRKRAYKDDYEKVVTYVWMVANPAKGIEPDVDPRTYPPYETTEEESVFRYLDTASSRAGISAISAKLDGLKIGIIGLGGTGSFILDLVAKTPVEEIHLFDGDDFQNHNAFRAPGAASWSGSNSYD